MTKITKERIEQYAHDKRMCNVNEEVREMSRMLLAGMGQEPVAYIVGKYNLLHASDPKVDYYIDRAEPLYAAPLPAPVVPEELLSAMEEVLRISDRDHEAWQKVRNGIASCRAAMLQAGKSPVVRDGWVMVPVALTVENGAKACLIGEFSETTSISCPECFGADECETCDGSGAIKVELPVSWTTIKAIWARGVEHFAAAPQQEVK